MFNDDDLHISLEVTQIRLVDTPPVLREIKRQERTLRLCLTGLTSMNLHTYILTKDYIIVQDTANEHMLKISLEWHSAELWIPGGTGARRAQEYLPVFLFISNTNRWSVQNIQNLVVKHTRRQQIFVSAWRPTTAFLIHQDLDVAWYIHKAAQGLPDKTHLRIKPHDNHHAEYYRLSNLIMRVSPDPIPSDTADLLREQASYASPTRICQFYGLFEESAFLAGSPIGEVVLMRALRTDFGVNTPNYLIWLEGHLLYISEHAPGQALVWSVEPGVLTSHPQVKATLNSLLIDV